MTGRGVEEALEYPQPLGAFGLPAGLLLVPGGEATRAAREALVAGRLPSLWPAELAVHRAVHDNRGEEALALLAAADPDDGIAAYHRWLLDPTSAHAAAVRRGLPSQVAPLVDVVRHSLGEAAPPAPEALDPGVVPEVRALAEAATAAAALEGGRVEEAVAWLDAAAETARDRAPILAALLRGNAGTLRQEGGILRRAADDLAAAVAALAGTDLADVRAELLLRLGSLAQERAAGTGAGDLRGTAGDGETAPDERALLHEAMRHYYEGLQLVSEDSAPELWAALNLNLAAAQLAVPMTQASDQLRLGVATQALRACRRVFTRSTHPAQWSTATLNLANALVYTPTTHREENLAEAVGLYEEVLASGVRDGDPLGRARLLSNAGNALAHLGDFDRARARLVEARFLFEEHLDHAGALVVRGILDEIRKAGVADPAADPDAELAELARQAEQMSRIPYEQSFTAGMGVQVLAAPDATPPPPTRVSIVDPATRPTGAPR